MNIRWRRDERHSELQRDDDLVCGTVTEMLALVPGERWWAQDAHDGGAMAGFPTREEAERWLERLWLNGGRA